METEKFLVLVMGPSRELVVTNSERSLLSVDPSVLFFILNVEALSELKFLICHKVKAVVGYMGKELTLNLLLLMVFITV